MFESKLTINTLKNPNQKYFGPNVFTIALNRFAFLPLIRFSSSLSHFLRIKKKINFCLK